jgi:hypothetical protein
MRRYKRWISIGSRDPFLRTLRACKRFRIGIVNGWKPGMVAWYGLALEADTTQMKRLESWWNGAGIEWFVRPPRGAWPVSTAGEVIPWDEAIFNVTH